MTSCEGRLSYPIGALNGTLAYAEARCGRETGHDGLCQADTDRGRVTRRWNRQTPGSLRGRP